MRIAALILCGLIFSATVFAADGESLGVFEIDLDDKSIPFRFTHRAMGTEFRILIYDVDHSLALDGADEAAQQAFTRIDSLERLISSWIPTSNTSQINREAGREWVDAIPATWELLEAAKQIHQDTKGAFDVTVGPLVDVYRHDTPTEADIERAARLVGMDKVELDAEKRRVRFEKQGMRVSFGGIGKGLAIDKAAEVLRRYGVKSALISGGESSIFAIGAPPNRDFWRIAVFNPYNNTDRLAMVHLRDEALATSACGNAESCNVFDPRTGRPVSGVLSATVIASTGMVTDALSTSFFVMGTEGVRRYIDDYGNTRSIVIERPAEGTPQVVRIGSFEAK